MTESAASTAPTSGIPHIPLEIGKLIADELDLASARSLALSCKALRDVGELGVWRCLDITTDWCDSPEAITVSLDVSDAISHRAGTAIIDSKIKHAFAAFEAYPFRLSCVSAVRVEPSDGGVCNKRARSLLKLLTPLAPQLTRLELLPRPYSHLTSDEDRQDFPCTEFFAIMPLAGESAYTRITHLKYTCLIGAESTIPTWMERMVNLQELEFCGSRYFPRKHDDTSTLTHSLPHLRRLTFEKVFEHNLGNTHDMLGRLIEAAPNLEILRIKGAWAPKTRDRALRAIGSAESLRTLVLANPPGVRQLSYTEPGMRFEKFGRVTLGIEEAVVEMHGLEEGHELDFQALVMPTRAYKLQRITVHTFPRLTLAGYRNLPLEPTPEETRPIIGAFLRRLLRTPRLSHFRFHYFESYFPPLYTPKFDEPVYFVAPDQWAIDGHRGIIIRQYRRSEPTDEPGDDSLWHIRALSRAILHPSGQTYVGASRCWQDMTSYRGRVVPRRILQAVYAEAGLELESTDEGRDLDLGIGNKPWDILDKWRSTSGPGRQEEGFFHPNGWNSDEDDPESESEDGDEGDGDYDDEGGGPFMMGPHLNADGVYEDDDGPFGEEDYDDHEPYYGYETYEMGSEDEEDVW